MLLEINEREAVVEAVMRTLPVEKLEKLAEKAIESATLVGSAKAAKMLCLGIKAFRALELPSVIFSESKRRYSLTVLKAAIEKRSVTLAKK